MNRNARSALVTLLSAAVLLGCKSATRSDPAFAARWDELMASGARPIPVGDPPPPGEALLDSVHRSMRRRGASIKKAQVVAPPAAVPQPAAVPAPPPSEIAEAHLPGSDTPAAPSTPPSEPAADPNAAAGDPTATLADADLSRVIRSGLSGLKSCYRQAESAGSDGGGKAIVRFTILPTGTVDAVNVSAPSFEDSRLPGCVSMQVRAWRFPSFQGQPMEVTYPFLFTGT